MRGPAAARGGQRLTYLNAGGEADGLPRLRGGRRPTVGARARARARAKYKIFFIFLFIYIPFLQIKPYFSDIFQLFGPF